MMEIKLNVNIMNLDEQIEEAEYLIKLLREIQHIVNSISEKKNESNIKELEKASLDFIKKVTDGPPLEQSALIIPAVIHELIELWKH